MGVRHYRDLRAWQLAVELKRRIIDFTARPAVRADVRFCDQIRQSSGSVLAHIAEGFARYSHREFLQFLKLASGSLAETETCLVDALDRGYLILPNMTISRGSPAGAPPRLLPLRRVSEDATKGAIHSNVVATVQVSHSTDSAAARGRERSAQDRLS
jgi:four helix bundle protein